jgi:hypothetical protein
MSDQDAGAGAAAAGTFPLGGNLVVNRLGFGAMRLTRTWRRTWQPPRWSSRTRRWRRSKEAERRRSTNVGIVGSRNFGAATDRLGQGWKRRRRIRER